MNKATRLFLLYVPAVLFLLISCAPQGNVKPEDTLKTLDFRKVIKEAKKKVFPSVVYIKVLKESHEAGKKITQEVSGSGVIISPEGEVLITVPVEGKYRTPRL